jgi:predicted GIY-YIG superfamily endonuclease
MIKDLYFIYSLAHNDQVFYIGMCKDIVKRYRAHINSKPSTENGKYIQYIIGAGYLPQMNIIEYLPHKEAAKYEYQLIATLTQAGQKLTNSQCIRPIVHMPTNMPSMPSKRQMIKLLKYKQEMHVYSWTMLWDRSNLKSINRPFSPF